MKYSRSISEEGINLIKRFEGFSAQPYVCPGGYLTIGYGHVIREHEKGTLLSFVDREEADLLLINDIKIVETAVNRLISVPLNQHQFDALVSFTFNLGTGALQRSTLRRKVNNESHSEVPEELVKWVKVKNVMNKGLVRRRQAEALLYTR